MADNGAIVGSPPPDPPQLASPDQLPEMEQAAKDAGTANEAGKETSTCPKTSWFAIRVMYGAPGQDGEDGEDKPVDGLTLSLELSCSGPNKQTTSSGADKNQIDSLTPGGTCKVVSTDHSDTVWEVETDIA